MRTLVRGGWVVGFAGGGHTLVPDGVVVYEDDRIVHVGRRFDGRADAEIDAHGMLVCPGFIDTHVHSGHRASHRLITDPGVRISMASRFSRSPFRARGTRVGGDPRYARPTDADAEAGSRLLATFTVAEMLRNGITTFMEFGSQLRVQLFCVIGVYSEAGNVWDIVVMLVLVLPLLLPPVKRLLRPVLPDDTT